MGRLSRRCIMKGLCISTLVLWLFSLKETKGQSNGCTATGYYCVPYYKCGLDYDDGASDTRGRLLEVCCKPKETCKGKCCWGGPSRGIVNSGGRSSGVAWPEKNPKTVEECAKMCEENRDCTAFHYYGPKDTWNNGAAYKHCYLQKFGDMGPYPDDGRDRYSGICS